MNRFLPKLMLWLFVSSLTFVNLATAHEVLPAVADVEITHQTIRVEVELTVESLLAGIDASRFSDTNDAPQADEYDNLRALSPGDLLTRISGNWDSVSSYFVVAGVEGPANWIFGSADIPEVGDVEVSRISTLRFRMNAPGQDPVSFGAVRALGPLIVRHVASGEDAFQGFLSPGEQSPALARSGGMPEGVFTTFARYLSLGVEHIVPKGLDHILFVLGLYFFSVSVRSLLWQVTVFTGAHTVTLALASLGVVSVPASIVEPLIAASIVYVAVENLTGGGVLSRKRIALVFLFGLLHGLGFASVLGDIGLGQGRFVVGLIGFNLGVEVGQLIVIAGAFVALGFWFRHRAFYRAFIAMPASVLIGLTGMYWFVERVFW